MLFKQILKQGKSTSSTFNAHFCSKQTLDGAYKELLAAITWASPDNSGNNSNHDKLRTKEAHVSFSGKTQTATSRVDADPNDHCLFDRTFDAKTNPHSTAFYHLLNSLHQGIIATIENSQKLLEIKLNETFENWYSKLNQSEKEKQFCAIKGVNGPRMLASTQNKDKTLHGVLRKKFFENAVGA